VQFHSGQIVSVSGIYLAEHNPVHTTNAFSEITLIRSRRFPICPHCDSVKFELIYADERRSRRRTRDRNHYRPELVEAVQPATIVRRDRFQFMAGKIVGRIRFGRTAVSFWLTTFLAVHGSEEH
jgi:hypothetical protein